MNPTFLIVSHQGRLNCLLNDLGFEIPKSTKFKNCCVLKLEIKQSHDGGGGRGKFTYSGGATDVAPQLNMKLTMIYEGDVEPEKEEKKKYYKKIYTVSSTDANDLKRAINIAYGVLGGKITGFTTYSGDEGSTHDAGGEPSTDKGSAYSVRGGADATVDLPFRAGYRVEDGERSGSEEILLPPSKPVNPIPITLPSDIKSATYYLIRHGEAEHNTWKGATKKWYQTTPMDKFKDTELTENGIYYGVVAGVMLANSMESDPRNFDQIYTSDLNRTLKTFKAVREGFNQYMTLKKKETISYEATVIILPCNHELTTTEGGNCDNNQIFTPNENTTLKKWEGERNSHPPVDLDTRLYESLYGVGGIRSKSINPKYCAKLNAIQISLNYYSNGTKLGNRDKATKLRTLAKWRAARSARRGVSDTGGGYPSNKLISHRVRKHRRHSKKSRYEKRANKHKKKQRRKTKKTRKPRTTRKPKKTRKT